jgi:hypothetical protein
MMTVEMLEELGHRNRNGPFSFSMWMGPSCTASVVFDDLRELPQGR